MEEKEAISAGSSTSINSLKQRSVPYGASEYATTFPDFSSTKFHTNYSMDKDLALFTNGDDCRPVTERYSFLCEDDLLRHVIDAIAQVSKLLSLPESEARILLLHHNWDTRQVVDSWSADEARIRREIDLLETQIAELPDKQRDQTCAICLETLSEGPTLLQLSVCGHLYCRGCCKSYISTQILDGPGCLNLRCPAPNCAAPVDSKMVEQLATEEEKHKLDRYLVMSYVDGKELIKWCPGPGCEVAVSWSSEGRNLGVTCPGCSHRFCWNCMEEPHRPVDCETAANWLVKNSSESENVNYILKFTKPCPHCKRPIEKNGGCMHIHCRACRHYFCWACLKLSCDRGRGCVTDAVLQSDENRRKLAVEAMEKYSHYFDRWEANLRAMEDLRRTEEQMGKLCEVQRLPEGRLEFISDAWRQMIECRRVLRWSYPYGYYLLPEEEAKRRVLEDFQGQIECGMDRLDQCSEKVRAFMEVGGGCPEGFDELRKELKRLTRKTQSLVDGLLTALENGLPLPDGASLEEFDLGSKKRCKIASSTQEFEEPKLAH